MSDFVKFTDAMFRAAEYRFHDPRGIFNATWIVEAPWAHPHWHQYAIFLYDLTTPAEKPTLTYRAGVTHEVMVWALDPQTPISYDSSVEPGTFMGALLSPANHGYQFAAADDEAAVARVRDLVKRIANMTLNPDTDARRTWDALFVDGASLLTGAPVATTTADVGRA